ncbi:MAG: hypothetical protein QNJ41_21445 [Xenococcaceae cyanobacterium MO_188.B32]|nr:hypothetical protein [Xenococcaceae cyanobacterium MO_188.B32]
MEELEQKFETLLARWVPDKESQTIWQNYLHSGGSVPEDDLGLVAPVFLGRSQLNSLVEVRESDQGDYEVLVDGTQVQRLPRTFSFGDSPYRTVSLVNQEWTEISRASEPALQVLKHYVEFSTGEPPWQWARMLCADGLIYFNFGLTSRGRRVLSQQGQ